MPETTVNTVIPALGAMNGWNIALFAAAALIVAAVVYVLWLRPGRLTPVQRFWWFVTAFYARVWFRMRRIGPCTIPRTGPVIVVANHTAPIDPLLIVASTPYRVVGFMIAEEFSNIPIGRSLTRMIGCIPVRRDGQDAAATRAAMRHLKQGNVLGIFIEGRIARPGEQLEPKEGPALLALRTGATVVPAFISGTKYTETVLPSFFIPHKARIRFGTPIDLTEFLDAKRDKDTVARVARLMMNRIRELGERPA